MVARLIAFTWSDDDGAEHEDVLPAKLVVCSRCDGEGSHVNPAIDGNGITSSEWADDWDDDSREAYMRGDYDVTCEACEGRNVEFVIDEEAIERGDAETKELYERYLEKEESLAEMRAEEAAERRMGA